MRVVFERFYGSLWQHPLLLIVVPLAFWFILPQRTGFFYFYLRLFTIETIVDPIMTGPVVDELDVPRAAARSVMIAFVVLGDLRFFALMEHMSHDPERGGGQRIWLRAGLLSLVVPLLQAICIIGFPRAFESPRHTFLAYELLFVAIVVIYHLTLLEPRQLAPQLRAWFRKITLYAVGYYLLWASADVIILADSDLGYLLRVVPNVLYYGTFLPFVYWTAPPEVRK